MVDRDDSTRANGLRLALYLLEVYAQFGSARIATITNGFECLADDSEEFGRKIASGALARGEIHGPIDIEQRRGAASARHAVGVARQLALRERQVLDLPRPVRDHVNRRDEDVALAPHGEPSCLGWTLVGRRDQPDTVSLSAQVRSPRPART